MVCVFLTNLTYNRDLKLACNFSWDFGNKREFAGLGTAETTACCKQGRSELNFKKGGKGVGGGTVMGNLKIIPDFISSQ